MEKNILKTLIFAVAGYNLAETGRHIEIAKACRGEFNIVFLSYGGAYESLIEEEGFTLKKMEPRLTEKQLHHVRKALSGETLNTVGYFTAKEMEPRVENEIKFFKEIKPTCVLTGWCQHLLPLCYNCLTQGNGSECRGCYRQLRPFQSVPCKVPFFDAR